MAVNKHQIVRIEESLEMPKIPSPEVRSVPRRKPKAAATSHCSAELPGPAIEDLVPPARKVRRRKPKAAAPGQSSVELPGPATEDLVPPARKVRRRKPKAAAPGQSSVELPGPATESQLLSPEAESH